MIRCMLRRGSPAGAQVPLEHLRRVTKDRKHVADELAATLASVKALTESSGQGSAESAEELERLIATTQGLKRKVGACVRACACVCACVRVRVRVSCRHTGTVVFVHTDACCVQLVGIAKQERESAQRCKARLDHLVAHEAPPSQSAMDWTRQRLDRLLVDHMLRSGYLKSATDLASTSGCEVRPCCNWADEACAGPVSCRSGELQLAGCNPDATQVPAEQVELCTAELAAKGSEQPGCPLGDLLP